MIRSASRRGSVLVVVAGLCALLSAMTLAFVMRMRADGEDANRMSQDIQARVMLSAALMYVQETGRIGWGGETFGWRDVRDGMAGPRGLDGDWTPMLTGRIRDDGRAVVGTGVFPAIAGRAARNPMYVMRRPPCAIMSTIAPNPIPLVDPQDTAALSLPWDKLVNYAVADPRPVAGDPLSFRAGDPAPLQAAGIASWFRVLRTGAATFVITCGAGASGGFRDWDEVIATPGAVDIFGTREDFAAIRAAEAVRWYEAEWTDLVTGNNFLHGHYARHNTRYFGTPTVSAEETPNMRQFAGTFTFIANLPGEPPDW